MKNNNIFFRLIFIITVFIIIFPLFILAVWGIVENWRYPDLLPQSFSLRGLNEVFNSKSDFLYIVLSSISISVITALLSTAVGTLTARATVFYNFPFKNVIAFLNLLPLVIPAAAFAMGIHITFIKLGISDTILGVIIIHLICSLPYSVNIMTDITKIAGRSLEEQANQFGANQITAFCQISFPSLLPGIISSFCISYIISFSQYFITLIIGGGNVKTLSTIMIPYIQSGDRTISASYSIVFILSDLLIFIAVEKISKILGSSNIALVK